MSAGLGSRTATSRTVLVGGIAFAVLAPGRGRESKAANGSSALWRLVLIRCLVSRHNHRNSKFVVSSGQAVFTCRVLSFQMGLKNGAKPLTCCSSTHAKVGPQKPLTWLPQLCGFCPERSPRRRNVAETHGHSQVVLICSSLLSSNC